MATYAERCVCHAHCIWLTSNSVILLLLLLLLHWLQCWAARTYGDGLQSP